MISIHKTCKNMTFSKIPTPSPSSMSIPQGFFSYIAIILIDISNLQKSYIFSPKHLPYLQLLEKQKNKSRKTYSVMNGGIYQGKQNLIFPQNSPAPNGPKKSPRSSVHNESKSGRR